MHSVRFLVGAFISVGTLIPAVHAAAIVKAANGNIYHRTSWVGGTLPGSTDTAVFDGKNSVVSPGGATFEASGNSTLETWAGLQVTDIRGPLFFSNVATVTVGSGGIDLSAATADVTFNSGTVRLATTATIQIASGRALTVAGLTSKANIYIVTITGGGTLVATGVVGASGVSRFSLDVTGPGTTLAGTGTYRPNNPKDDAFGIQIGSGAFIAPGHDGIGTLTLSRAGITNDVPLLNMAAGAGFKFALGDAAGSTLAAPGRGDQIAIAGAAPGCVVFANNTIDLRGGGEAGVYRLFKTDLANPKASTWKGLTLDGRVITAGLAVAHLADGLVGQLRVGNGAGNGDLDSIYLVVSSAIPEPSAYGAK